MSNRARHLVLAALMFLVSSVLHAQAPATSLSELPQWVRIGDRVTVTDASGRRLTGRIGAFMPDGFSLVRELRVRDSVREYRQGEVQAITRRDSDSLRNGALIGLGVGAGFFLAAFAASDGCGFERDCLALVTIGTAFYAGVGASIGVGIDALVPGKERVIYRRPAGRVTMGIAPRVSAQRQAVVLSVRF